MNKKKWITGFLASVTFGIFCALCWIGAQAVTSTTYAQIPTSSPGGTMNLLTNGCLFAFNITSAGSRTWYPQPFCASITPPTAASTWTLVTSGSATKNDVNGSVVISTTAGNAAMEGILKAIPGGAYTLQFTFSFIDVDTVAGGGCGPYWANGSATSSSVQWAQVYSPSTTNGGAQFRVIHGTNYALAGATVDKGLTNSLIGSQVMRITLQDDTTNRYVILSNGTSTVQVYSTPRTTFITPTNYGFACSSAATGLWEATLLGVD